MPDEIPAEVWKVWAMQYSCSFVGLETLNEINDIIAKYPQHFPWETKYNSLPKEVHEAFRKECYPSLYEPYEPFKYEGTSLIDDVKNGKGIIDISKPKNVTLKPFTAKDFLESWEKMINDEQERKQKEFERKERIRKIWDKHYKQYGLECREF